MALTLKRKNFVLVVMILATLLLGVLAVITALKLYQAGKEPVAPTAPARPEAVVPACRLSFAVPTQTPTATPTGTITPSPGPTSTPEPTATSIPGPTSTPTSPPGEVTLPEAGFFSPTFLVATAGFLLTLLGLLF